MKREFENTVEFYKGYEIRFVEHDYEVEVTELKDSRWRYQFRDVAQAKYAIDKKLENSD